METSENLSIGNGPSRVMMRTTKSVLQFKEKHKGINNYRVTLYGLAATEKDTLPIKQS